MRTSISMDIGFGRTKVVASGPAGDFTCLEFPTAVAHIPSADDDLGLRTANDGICRDPVTGRLYVVGEQAVGHPNVVMTKGGLDYLWETPLLVQRALDLLGTAWGVDRKEISVDVFCTGVPIMYAGRKDEVLQQIRKSLAGVLGDIQYHVFVQGVGAVYDYRFDRDGHVQKDRLQMTVASVDIGENTVDVAVTVEGRFIRDECTSMMGAGVTKIINDLNNWVQTHYGVTLNPFEVQGAVVRSRMRLFGQEVDLKDVLTKAVRTYNDFLWNRLVDRFMDLFARMDRILICGGGGNLIIEDAIPERLRPMVEVLEMPSFANARGWLKAVRLIHRIQDEEAQTGRENSGRKTRKGDFTPEKERGLRHGEVATHG